MIEHIRIQNFKSLRDVSVDLTPVTVLIGRSGVGKSNFLRAIRFLRNYLLDGNSAPHAEGGWQRIFPFGTKAPLSFSIRFTIPEYEQKFNYEVAWKPHSHVEQLFPFMERLRMDDAIVFGRSDQQWEAWPDARPKPAIQPQLYLSSFPTVSAAVLAFTFLTSGIGWHDFPADVFQTATKNQSSENQGLSDSANNFLDVLRDLTKNLQSQHARRQILARVRQINPSVASLELDSIIQAKQVIVSHRVADRVIPLDLSQESDGFRRYYAHLLAIYQTPPKQVLMFEEPENGVYPGALRNLAEEFKSASESGRGQVLLTTQSPDLLDGFGPESIRVVDVNKSQETQIGVLDPSQMQALRDQLLEPGELLTVDKARAAGAST